MLLPDEKKYGLVSASKFSLPSLRISELINMSEEVFWAFYGTYQY